MSARNYLLGKEALDPRYSEREQSHFSDVKIILDFTKALVLILFIFVFIYFTLFFMLNKNEIFKKIH